MEWSRGLGSFVSCNSGKNMSQGRIQVGQEKSSHTDFYCPLGLLRTGLAELPGFRCYWKKVS